MEPVEKHSAPKRRQESSLLSKWTFSYMWPVINRGFKKNLEPSDYLPMEDEDRAQGLSTALLDAWAAEQQRTGRPQMWRVILSVYWNLILGSGVSYALEMVVKIGEVLVMGGILVWFQSPDADFKRGYLLGLGLFLLGFIHAILHHVEFFLSMRCGLQMRITFIAAIYKKCLNLSLSHTSSTGMIVNLVSNDVQRFEDAAPFAHFIWLGPLEVVLMTYFMYQQIGNAAFAAVGGLLLMIPLQGWFARMFAVLRKRTVGLRDERIKSIGDSLAGMLVVKLYAWENAFETSINGIRDEEMRNIRKASYIRAINEAFFFASGSLIEIFAFVTFWLIGGQFTPDKVFTCIAYMSSIRLSMTNFFPKALQFLTESRVSMDRIQEFLSLPDIRSHRHVKNRDGVLGPNDAIAINNGSFRWGKSSNAATDAVLQHLSLRIKIGELVSVVGAVGAGKSSLLNAILGEMDAIEGSVIAVHSQKLAYCTQTPFILSGTVRDNVTFGLVYDEEKFRRVMHACAMDRDLELFSSGDLTVIGERGVTLSGGQRARLALARAVYSDADIYLLDDPLSAVDTKVGRHLFEHCINGYLKSKTRILVTHQLQFAKLCDTVLIVEHGKISAKGSFETVLTSDISEFAKAMKYLEAKSGHPEEGDVDDLAVEAEIGNTHKNVKVEDATDDIVATKKKEDQPPSGTAPLILAEESFKGSVKLSVYWNFFRSGASAMMFLILATFLVVGQASLVLTDYFLSRWSLLDATSQRNPANLGIFLSLALGTVIVAIARAELFFYCCLNSTEQLFRKMLHSVYRSPITFFQQNPLGRLMNRFSKDMNLCDEMLPLTFFDFTQCVFMILGTLFVAVIIIPYVLISVPIVAYVFVYFQRYYVATSRQVKRFEAVTRSPVYTTVPSTLEGLSTIRAYGSEDRFSLEFMAFQDENTRAFFNYLSGARWLGLRLDVLSSVFLGIVSFACVALKGPAGVSIGLNSGTAGLLLTYSLQLVGTLQWAVRQNAEVENMMVSVERVLEYSSLEPEAPSKTDADIQDDWPSKGEIAFKGMSMAYPTSPLRKILKDVTITIPGGMKVGVVGRTGAGKSSLLQVLFRLVEPTPENSIVLDGISTSSVGLFDLRSRISIIPQEPFCFKGTLRYNLDPFGVFDDAALWAALASVELKASVETMPEGLESAVAENGSNWSVGERQLICLARAILRNSKLIVLDEATSSVDMHTDALIQKAIRSKTGLFASSTVLCIAHRLQTIIDFDRVLVLEQGEVVEFGSPYELLQKDSHVDPGAWFTSMVSQMGEDAQAQLKAMAFEKFQESTIHSS